MRRPLAFALALLLLAPPGADAAVVTRRVEPAISAAFGSPAHEALARVAARMPHLPAPPVDGAGRLHLIAAGGWLAAAARVLSADGSADPATVAAVLDAERTLSAALSTAGARDISLTRACEPLRGRGSASTGAANTAPPDAGAGTDRLETRTYIENTLYFRAGTRRDPEISDRLLGRVAVADRKHGADFALEIQNPDRADRHLSHVETLDHAAALTEARVTLAPRDLRGLTLDLGRHRESFGSGAFHDGYADGARMRLAFSRAELSAGAHLLAPRYRDAGYGEFVNRGTDTRSLGLAWNIRGGRIGAYGLKSDLTPRRDGARPIATVSTAIYPAAATAPLAARSYAELYADADVSRTVRFRGHAGRHDVEGYDAGGTIGRAFRGLDLGASLVRRELDGPTALDLSVRAREIDVFSLGRPDDLFACEYFNDRNLSPTQDGGMLAERLGNSVAFTAGVSHALRQRWLPRPVDLRLAVEALDGWKDLDPNSAGRQDGIFAQHAVVFHAGYRAPNGWSLLTRTRGVLHDKEDADHVARAAWNAAPRDRAEFGMRLVSPAF